MATQERPGKGRGSHVSGVRRRVWAVSSATSSRNLGGRRGECCSCERCFWGVSRSSASPNRQPCHMLDRSLWSAALTPQLDRKTITLERTFLIASLSLARPATLLIHPTLSQQPARPTRALTLTLALAPTDIRRPAPTRPTLPQPDRSDTHLPRTEPRARAPLGPDSGFHLRLGADRPRGRKRVCRYDPAVA